MANSEWSNSPDKRNCLTEKAIQELTHYYKHIFTLKNGKQIEICTKLSYDEAIKDFSILESDFHREIKGFIISPLLVEKTVRIRKSEIAAREEIKDPCIAQVIPWPEEVDTGFTEEKKKPLGSNLNDEIGCEG